MTDFTSLWDDAGSSAETEAAQQRLATAKVATQSLWPFLALALDEVEFGQRLDLASDRITTAAARHGVEPSELVATFTREFGLLQEARKVTASSTCAHCGHTNSRHADGAPCSCGCEAFAPKTAAKQAANAADCADCHGTGHAAYNGTGPANARCSRCNGTGTTKTSAKVTCPDCYGARSVPAQGHEPYDEVDGGQVRCPTCAGHGVVSAQGQGEHSDDRTAHERYGDAGDYSDAGDAQDSWYGGDYLASLKTALEEGQDPLAWLEQEGAGQGQPEKAGGHTTTNEQTTPDGNQPVASRRPF